MTRALAPEGFRGLVTNSPRQATSRGEQHSQVNLRSLKNRITGKTDNLTEFWSARSTSAENTKEPASSDVPILEHRRICEECGHVGCCDLAKNKHATKHFHKSKHPLIRSIEPGEEWVWCYVDQIEPGEMRPEGFVPIRG